LGEIWIKLIWHPNLNCHMDWVSLKLNLSGWLTYNPIKVEISPIGDITVVEEKKTSNTQKLTL